ncbi:hypothetical protein KC573_02930 [candidate division WWE3 bacterium]|uniref:Uncharacterized protein n=1 Tax=candidate division WWE3 bacterium TaxID=2053526 RepID=A0A955LVY8_UNCKA|nr:hypothetical protein [candidate division WWE3 bacterium]
MKKFPWLVILAVLAIFSVFALNASAGELPEEADEVNAPTPAEAAPECWLNIPYGIENGNIVYLELWCNLPANPAGGDYDYLEIEAQFALNIGGYDEGYFTWDFNCASPPLASCGGRNWDVYSVNGVTSMEIVLRSDKAGGLTTSRMKGPGQVRLGFGRIVITQPPTSGCVNFTPEFYGGASEVQLFGSQAILWPSDKLSSHSTCGTFVTPTPPPSPTPTTQPTATPSPTQPGPTATPTTQPPGPTVTPSPTQTPSPAPTPVDCSDPGTYCVFLPATLNQK